MMENRKRPRENTKPTHDPKHKTNPPPSKKRRLQTKNKKKANEDMSKWSTEELKKYLNKNAITFQMNKNQPYYYRLATMHKIVQNQKDKTNDTKEASPPENSSFNDTIDHNKHEKESPESPPIFTTPRKSTPPLPLNLCHKPLISDTFSEESSSEPHQSEAFSIEKHDTLPVNKQPMENITPYTFKSRSLLSNNITPTRPIRINNITCNINIPNEVPITEVIEEQIPSQTHSITYEQTQPEPEPEPETYRKLGPFQDMRIPRLHVPNMFKPPTNNTIMNSDNINDGRRWNNKFLLILGGMVMTIIISMLIPYGISLFMNEPYCDTNNNHISGSYYGLQSIMKCKPCPYQSEKCINGEVQCPENYTLDKYGVMCLNNENINEEFASQIAYKINYLLGVKLGENDCNYSNNSDIYLDENELKTEIYKLYEDKDNDDLTGAWDMAIKGIIPNAYVNIYNTVIYDNKSESYKAFRPIPPSYYCKGLYLKKEYLDNKTNYFFIVWAVIVIICALLIVGIALRSKSNEMDEQAMDTANFVLVKLSTQPLIHFSIITIKHWVVRKRNVSFKTWEKTLKYINQSRYVDMIPEDIDGQVRMCWKWKGVVPFVPLN